MPFDFDQSGGVRGLAVRWANTIGIVAITGFAMLEGYRVGFDSQPAAWIIWLGVAMLGLLMGLAATMVFLANHRAAERA